MAPVQRPNRDRTRRRDSPRHVRIPEDPPDTLQQLEAYALEGGDWREIGRLAGGAQVSVAPFDAVTIALNDLWAPTE